MTGECEHPGCKEEATTTYRDKARQIWKLCEKHRLAAKKRRA
jgi:hypothetical protein